MTTATMVRVTVYNPVNEVTMRGVMPRTEAARFAYNCHKNGVRVDIAEVPDHATAH